MVRTSIDCRWRPDRTEKKKGIDGFALVCEIVVSACLRRRWLADEVAGKDMSQTAQQTGGVKPAGSFRLAGAG
jgi:hypothetical protein